MNYTQAACHNTAVHEEELTSWTRAHVRGGGPHGRLGRACGNAKGAASQGVGVARVAATSRV